MNIKKMFTTLSAMVVAVTMTLPSASVFGATYSQELQDAYNWAHEKGVTTMDTIDNANMYGAITRAQMAKMLSVYAKEVLGNELDTSKACTFTDIDSVKGDLHDFIIESCQLGIMGQGITAFRPYDTISRAEFGTALSRVLWGNKYEGGTPYYAKHLEALKAAGIMTQIDNPEDRDEVRGYVMLMLMRSDEGAGVDCDDEMVQLACAMESDQCPAACRDSGEEEDNGEKQDPEEVKAGELAVTVTSEEGGEFPSLVSALPVATYTLKANDEDITVNSIVIEEGGYAIANTLEAALYIDGQRVSKVKKLAQLDKEYTLNLTNAYTVKAGKSVDIEVRVSDVNPGPKYAQQFNIKLVDVNSSAAEVDLPSNTKSNTFKLLENNTATLTVAATTALDNPKAGTKGADLFEIRLDNTAGTQDVEFNSVTLLGQSAASNPKDLAEDLDNVELVLDGDVLAKGQLDGKYLTFVLDTPYAIEKGKKATFTVRADIVGGAGKTYNYALEEAIDLSATAVAYEAPVTVKAPLPTFTSFTISAGRVVIERTNPSSNTFTKNRTNLYLGSFTITDNNKSDLRLDGFDIVFNAAVNTYIDAVKVRYGSNTAGLVEGAMQTDNKTFRFDDEQSIGSKLTVYVYADIKDVPVNGTSFTAQAANFKIVESENDTPVSDMSKPNSWMLMNGNASALNLTNVKLSNEDYAKGAEDVEAVSFKVKTNATEGVKMKRLEFDATCNTPTSCVVNSNTIRNATLVVGDKEYTATVSAGKIKVSDTIELPADTTTTFTLKVDLASNPDATNFSYKLTTYEAEDTSADRNDLSPTAPITTIVGRTINVKTQGELTISLKNNIENNKKDKSILAGTEAVVAEYTLKTTHEDLKVVNGTIKLDVTGLTSTDRIDDVQLWYDGELVASDADMSTAGSIIFDDVNFDIKSAETPLVVKVLTKKFTSDSDKVLVDCNIDSITFSDVYGKVSGEKVTTTLTNTTKSKAFDIVPATLTVTKLDGSSNTKTELRLTVDKGDNKRSSSNEIKTYVRDLAFNVYATDEDIKQVIVKKGSDTLAVVKYATSAPTSSTSVACAKIGSTNYYRCDINPNLSVWELEEGNNDVTLLYQVASSDVSYTADLVAAKFVADVDNSVTTANTFDALKAATSYNNRMDTLSLVSK